MVFEDKKIICKDCGSEFVFTAGEQEFYAEKGFANEPVRCRPCRDARKSRMNNGQNRNDNEMYEVVCAGCGVTTRVPFKPTNNKPVYCRACFIARK